MGHFPSGASDIHGEKEQQELGIVVANVLGKKRS